jgi:predicted ATPase
MGVKWTDPGAERAFIRARALSEQLNDHAGHFRALFGLCVVYEQKGEIRLAYDLAKMLMDQAKIANDPALLLLGGIARGETLLFSGELLRAREQLEECALLYDDLADPQRHRRLQYRSATSDGGVSVLSVLSLVLWLLGYPGQALKRSDEAVAVAKALTHPNTEMLAEANAGILRQFRRDVDAVKESAKRLIKLATEHGLADHSQMALLRYGSALILNGWSIADGGANEEGIAQIEEGLAATQATETGVSRPYFLCLLTEALIRGDRFDDGLNCLAEAIATVAKDGGFSSEAGICRLKGELLLRQDKSNTAEAEAYFRHSIEIAAKQSAKSLELGATMSLARLLRDTGRRDEARSILAEIYGWFTEGFDTRDLIEAKALLEELNSLS